MQRPPLILPVLTSVLLLVVLSLESCKKSITEPPPSVDSTSHIITWRTDTLAHGSYVHDIAIIDENNIWAVGSFYLYDSSGQIDPTLYNVMRWDGLKWNPLRLTVDYQGTTYLRKGDAIIAFGPTDIWLSAGGPCRWDGKTLTVVVGGDNPGEVKRFWGTSSSNLYMVSSRGRLTHFDGSSYSQIQTGGIQSFFCDITGRGEDEVYVGSYYYDNQIRPSGVFSYRTGGSLQFIGPATEDSSTYQAMRDAFGLWVSPKEGTLWAIGESLLFQPFKSHTAVYDNYYMLLAVRGLSDNDVWVAGDRGTIAHYNGASWKKYTAAELNNVMMAPYTEYLAIAVKGNIVAAGGTTGGPYGNPIVTVGKRVVGR